MAVGAPRKAIDRTTGRTIVSALEHADTAWTRFRGLMMRRNLPNGGGMLIEPCGSIQMTFMRFAIDAIFIDRTGVVTRVARRVPKWWGFAWGGRGTHAVIELPAGAAADVAVGHMIAFE
jgi:uncharacterized protein